MNFKSSPVFCQFSNFPREFKEIRHTENLNFLCSFYRFLLIFLAHLVAFNHVVFLKFIKNKFRKLLIDCVKYDTGCLFYRLLLNILVFRIIFIIIIIKNTATRRCRVGLSLLSRLILCLLFLIIIIIIIRLSFHTLVRSK